MNRFMTGIIFIERTSKFQKVKGQKKEFILYCMDIEEKLIEIQNHLIYRTYIPGRTCTFWIHDPVKRKIVRPYLTDRIVHTAIDQVTRGYFERYYISDTFACRKDKGPLKCIMAYQKMIRSAIGKWGFDFYVLSFDFKSFFATISHDVLKKLYKRIIPDYEVYNLMCIILDSYHESESLDGDLQGCPIGFLPSQQNGNLVASIVDHLIKDIAGIKYYVRYMDDGRIICKTKDEAKQMLEYIESAAGSGMRQKLSEKKTRIQKFRGSDTLCGYIVHPHHLEPKETTKKRSERRLSKKMRLFQQGKISANELRSSAVSFLAYLSHTNEKDSQIANQCILLANQWK